MVKLDLGVVDLVDACAKLVSLNSETLLTFSFACLSVLLMTFFGLHSGVYSTLDVLTFRVP